MSDAMQMMGSPITREINGREYKFNPITIGDLGDFESWVASERLRVAIEALGKDAKPMDKVALIQAIHNDSSGIDVMAEITSMRGIIQILWQSLRVHQPDMSKADVGNLFKVKNISEMQALVDVLAYSGEADDTDPPVTG